MSQEYVLGFAFDDWLDYLVLIKKNRPEWQKDYFNGVGGKIELNENPLDAMKREFKEETGLMVENWEAFGILKGDWGRIHLFAARLPKGSQIKTKTDEEVKWILPDSLNAYVCVPNLLWLIPLALNHLKKFDKCKFFEIIER